MTNEFETIHRLATEAGKAAAMGTAPGTPVVLYDAHFDDTPVAGGNRYVFNEFPCGFAWVVFAGNTAFGRWAKKKGIASPGYPTGLHVWISDYNQSHDRKSAHARAYAKVLNDHGIKAYADSRLD